MDYKVKYIKYKTKYLELKIDINNQIGGGKKKLKNNKIGGGKKKKKLKNNKI